MTDRDNLYKGTFCAAWGYLFLWFDFNLNNISILPAFAGYLLFRSAIRRLSAERREFTLLEPLAVILALWHGADWLASWAETTLDGRFPPLDLIIAAVSLYFHFQFLTDLAALAAAHQTPDQKLDRQLLRWRDIYVLVITALTLILYLPDSSVRETAGIVLLLAACLVCVVLMIQVFTLRRLFRADDVRTPPSPSA